jgi:hypothetical protein
MADAASEEEILNAIGKVIARRDPVANPLSPGAARLSWHSMLTCRILRSMETRSEEQRVHAGKFSLSRRPVYESLEDHRLPPPRHPSVPQQRTLVRNGSIREETCDCGNGRAPCPRCQGHGRLPCEPTVPCEDCKGADSCVSCKGGAKRRSRAASAAGEEADARATCANCGALQAACPTCAGLGRTVCAECQGEGFLVCPGCDSTGTIEHGACRGSGLLTVWTEGIFKHVPDREKVKLPDKRPPLLVQLWARFFGRWRRASLALGQPLPGDLEEAHRAAVESRLFPRKGEVQRQVDIRHLPLARVDVVLLPHRVYYAFPGKSGIRVVPLPSKRRVALISAIALAAAALALAVVLLVR